MLSTFFGVDLPFPVKHLWKQPHLHASGCVSWVILIPIKLTMINCPKLGSPSVALLAWSVL